MAIGDYFTRPDSEKILLAIIAYSGGTLYLADRPYITEPTDTPPNQPFEPLIQTGGIPEFRQSIQELAGGRSARSAGELKLAAADYNGTDLRTLLLRNSSIELRIAAPRRLFPYSDSVLWLRGVIGVGKGNADGRLSYEITDRQRDLEAISIPQNVYIEGIGVPSGLVDRPKPLGFGSSVRAPMVLIDSVNLVYQVHDTHLDNLISLRELEDDGNPLFAAGMCTVTSPPTDQVALGTWASAEDDFYNGGDIRLTAPSSPTSRVILDYDGATRTATLSGPDVTVAYTECEVDLYTTSGIAGTAQLFAPAEGVVSCRFTSAPGTSRMRDLVPYIATNYGGMIAGDIDVSNDIDVGIQLWISDEVPIADLFTALARGEFSWWGFDRNDKLIMRPIEVPVLPADHTIAFDELVRESVTWRECSDIAWRVIYLYVRNWLNTGTAALAETDEVFFGRAIQEDVAVQTAFADAISRVLQSYSGSVSTAAQRALDFLKVCRHTVSARLPFAGTVFQVGETIDLTGAPAPINSPLLVTMVRGKSDGTLELEMIG